MSQPEIVINGTTFIISETALEIHEYGYYQEIPEDEIPALISFLAEHFGAPRD